MNEKLKRGMIYVFVGSIVNLIFRLAINFILPKFLSVENYAIIKTYQLYISYASLFALGYIDGMYIEYGGKDLKTIDSDELVKNVSVCRTFQLILSMVLITISIIIKNIMLLLFSISIVSTNLIAYFHNLYQATGNFKSYSKITSYTSLFTFAINVILIFIIKCDNAIYYIIGYILLNTCIWILLELKMKMKLRNIKVFYFSFKVFFKNVRSGILLTLGQLSSVILTGLDRWFVKFFMNTIAFAEYSFGVSIENFLTIAVTPITVTLYNGFCQNKEEKYVNRLLELIVLFATFLISVAFGAKFVLENYLQKYNGAIKIIFILFAAQIYYIIVKSVYVNLYKATKLQKKYFIKLVIIIIMGIITNYVFYKIMKSKEAFSFGTLFCAIIWFILSKLDFKQYKIRINTYIFLFLETALFILLGFYIKSIIAFVIYIFASTIFAYFFMNESFKYAAILILKYIKKKIKTDNIINT